MAKLSEKALRKRDAGRDMLAEPTTYEFVRW
jgi:hypothetical protein